WARRAFASGGASVRSSTWEIGMFYVMAAVAAAALARARFGSEPLGEEIDSYARELVGPLSDNPELIDELADVYRLAGVRMDPSAVEVQLDAEEIASALHQLTGEDGYRPGDRVVSGLLLTLLFMVLVTQFDESVVMWACAEASRAQSFCEAEILEGLGHGIENIRVVFARPDVDSVE
ncbi:MAG: hypothetical protein ACRDTD_30805, partial [Pseudonocardiaceae bacterium]